MAREFLGGNCWLHGSTFIGRPGASTLVYIETPHGGDGRKSEFLNAGNRSVSIWQGWRDARAKDGRPLQKPSASVMVKRSITCVLDARKSFQ
jgi:hypothetical protein